MWFRISISALCTAMLLVNACELVQPATKEQCEAVVDHVVRLAVDEKVGSDTPLNGVAAAGVSWLADVAGERDKAVRSCMGEMTQYEARCVLRSSSLKGVRKCD